ncbi:GTP-binding protein [Buchnera aphidicola (Hormaphis cornu)]|nr:GTP-binding protein [Buchnera aphidicola (Hormaphis cornu)]
MSNTNYFTRQHECKQKNLKKIVVFKENFKHTNNDSKNQIVVSIIGKPNVGKSTLINSLIHTNRVVTDDYPGTTQDSISIPVIDFLGHQYTFIDTAGVRKIKTINKFSEKKCNISNF